MPVRLLRANLPSFRLPFGRLPTVDDSGMSRRDLLRAGALGTLGLIAGSTVVCAAPAPSAGLPVVLGPLSSLSPAALQLFPSAGVALARLERGIALLSTRCTHLGCALRVAGRELVCPCHGGRFDAEGRVVSGPPRDDLPFLEGGIDSSRQLFVFPCRPDPERRTIAV